MASSKDRGTSALKERLAFFGRTAGALRARVARSIGFGAPERAVEYPTLVAEPKAVVPVASTKSVPEGVCLYAVGDIHGRRDLLERLVEMIEEDAARLPANVTPQIVFLGDYIDRGLQSRDVINYFLSGKLDRFQPVFLMGNHEEALLRFLQDASFGSQWTRYGGAETLYSYGLSPPNKRASLNSHEEMAAARDAWSRVWSDFQTRLPAEHRAFYQSLKPYHLAGDYLFVHAGLRPGVPLEQQTARDMLWIREEFLDDTAAFDQIIVHGHTPEDSIHHDGRRIGLDTGAFLTGRLSAVRLVGTDVAFLNT